MSQPKVEIGLLGIIWVVCTFAAWGSYLGQQDIGVIGIICWTVSLVGIGGFIAAVLNEF